MQYRTKSGDMLDAICFRYYNGRPKALEAVLQANPFLASKGPILQAGIVIELPELEPIERAKVSLWD